MSALDDREVFYRFGDSNEGWLWRTNLAAGRDEGKQQKERPGEGNFEIGRILNLKSEIRNLRLDWPEPKPSSDFCADAMCDFGFRIRDARSASATARSPKR